MTDQLDRYRIEAEIGQGGFAIVYRAYDNELDRQVALKELKPVLLQDTGWVRRFRREARAIARLDHPRIVTIYDVKEIDQRLFIVMRLVDGPSLEDLIARQGRLSWTEAVQVITAVAEGLDYAHGRGVLHRDLKPANILMDPERGPLLTDFGLAKLAGESSTSMTASGSVVGTPHYIAPEVWEGQGATAQADIYALGCILYEMLTGEKVFKGETPPAVMMAHFKPLTLPQVWPAGVPAGVAGVLTTALANRPANRYPSAEKMAAALQALVAGAGAAAAEPPGVRAPAAPPDIAPPADAAKPEPAEPAPAAPEAAPPPSVSPPPQVEAESEPPPAKKQGRGIGCVWTGIAITAGVVLLLAIGLGGFCSTVGQVVEQIMPTVAVGESTTKSLFVPLPDETDEVNLQLKVGGGRLTVAPGAEEGLVEGTVTYNVAQLAPQTTTNGSNIRLEAAQDIGLSAFTNQNIENRWDVSLGTTPMALTLEVAGTDSEVELGGLAILELEIMQGGANFELVFSEPNRVEMDQLSFGGGASNGVLRGLANARAQEVQFAGGVGSYTLEFGGQLQNDIDVTVEGGLGTVTIIVPEQTAAELTITEGQLANVSHRGGWEKVGDRYLVSGPGPRITFAVSMGPGSVDLRTE